MFKSISKRAYAASMAFLLVLAQVVAPVQPAFAKEGGNGGNDGNMIYCHQQQNGNWKVDMGAPDASDNINRFVIGYLQPGEKWSDVQKSDKYQPSVCAEFVAFNAPNLTPATCESQAVLSVTYTTSALDYKYSLDGGVTRLALETDTPVIIPTGATVYVYVYNALVADTVLKTFGPYEAAAPVCVEPEVVTPAEVTATDNCSTTTDAIVWTPVAGVEYYYIDSATNAEVVLQASGTGTQTTPFQGGQSITVYARVTDSTLYTIPATATTSWQLTFTNETCPVEPTEVTPIDVLYFQPCGPDNDFYGFDGLPAEGEGVIFNPDGSITYNHITYTQNDDRSISLTVESGYVLPEGTQTLYEINDLATACAEPVYTPTTCTSVTGSVAVTFGEEYTYTVSGTGIDGEVSLASGVAFTIGKQGTYTVNGYFYDIPVYTSTYTYPVLANCNPGQGNTGGETPVTPITSSTPVDNGVLPVVTPLPSPIELPRTGSSTNGFVIALIAALATYGAVYFAQPKRFYN